MELIFAWHVDADDDIERALMYDKAEEAARISQGVEAGNRILESWVLRSHGRMLDEAGVTGSAQLSAEYLEELPDIVRQVEEATKARMHVGVGSEPSEAIIARRIAEERGGDPAIVLYTPDLSEEARRLDEMSDDEASELDGGSPDDDGVVGGGPAGAGAPAAASGMAKAENQREPGEATQVAQGQLSPTAAQPSPPPSASISASPPSPGGQPAPQGQPQQGGQEPSEEEVLQAVGQVLTQFKSQLPFFEQQVKQANPQAYQAVMGMVQGMVAMAQRMASGSTEGTPPAGAAGGEMQKAERTKVEMEPDEGSQNDGGVCPKCGSPHVKMGVIGEPVYVCGECGKKWAVEPDSLTKAGLPATGRHNVVLPPGSRGVGAKARSVKVVEPVTGKATWHQVSVGQKLSGDGHSLSPRVSECPSADSPEKRAADAGLQGVPAATEEKPPQTAQIPGK
jgi:ribosomal protein L37AE/L43A